MTDVPQTDYDSPWKEIIERYFPEFMAFFFPEAYAKIDWNYRYTFLDKELQQVVRDAETGLRRVDKLVKVTRAKDGEEAWVLIHVEVQGQPELVFPERMYIYNYRLFDRYRRRVASLAVLADASPNWRPKKFEYELFGCQVSLDFPTVKLLDYEGRRDELEANSNPFAVVVMAHLQTLATRQQPQERYVAKLNLAKMLYQREYNRQDIIELFRFIDWVMTLPSELEEQFMADVTAYETQERKPYVTSVERIAAQRGLQQGLEQGLQQGIRETILEFLRGRFDDVPAELEAALAQIEDLEALRALSRGAATAVSLDAFNQLVHAKMTEE